MHGVARRSETKPATYYFVRSERTEAHGRTVCLRPGAWATLLDGTRKTSEGNGVCFQVFTYPFCALTAGHINMLQSHHMPEAVLPCTSQERRRKSDLSAWVRAHGRHGGPVPAPRVCVVRSWAVSAQSRRPRPNLSPRFWPVSLASSSCWRRKASSPGASRRGTSAVPISRIPPTGNTQAGASTAP